MIIKTFKLNKRALIIQFIIATRNFLLFFSNGKYEINDTKAHRCRIINEQMILYKIQQTKYKFIFT